MPEYYTCGLELSFKVFYRITLASACEGNCSVYYASYVVSKRRNVLPTDRVQELVYLHGNLRNTSSCNRLTSASAKPGSSLVNCIRNKMQQELLSVSV